MNEFERAWVTYGTKAVPAGASEEQVTQTRRAFYAGALVVMGVLGEIGDAPSNPTQFVTDEHRMKNLDQHINETFRGFIGG